MPGPIIICRRAYPGPAFTWLAGHARLLVADGPIRDRALAGEFADAEAVWSFGERVDETLLDALPSLRAIGNYGVGIELIDVEALTPRGIALVAPFGVNAGAVADRTFALLLSLRHRIREGEDLVRSGRWAMRGADEPIGEDVFGSTIGIVGLGAIGRAVARRARGFDMPILTTTRTPPDAARIAGLAIEAVTLDELLERSDVVSLHCPLTDATRGLIGARELALMKPGAVLLNLARGAICDEDALTAALVEGQIAGAGLDVFLHEPDVSETLRGLANVVLTPHNADLTTGTAAAMTDSVARGLVRALAS